MVYDTVVSERVTNILTKSPASLFKAQVSSTLQMEAAGSSEKLVTM
jgi:hypothetical protein